MSFDKISRIVLAAFCIGTGLVCAYLAFSVVDKSKFEPGEDNLTTLTGQVRFDPIYHKGRKSGEYFHIELFEYPEIKFLSKGAFLRAMDHWGILRNVKYLDTIELKVLTRDYEEVNRQISAEFSIKKFLGITWNELDIYSLKYHNREFVNLLYEAAVAHKKDQKISMILISIIFIGAGCYVYFEKPRPRFYRRR